MQVKNALNWEIFVLLLCEILQQLQWFLDIRSNTKYFYFTSNFFNSLRRLEMFENRSILNSLIVFLAIFGLIFVIGCGNSKQMQKMSDFLMEYSKAVDEYSDVIGKGEMGKRPEVEKKIKSFMSKWTEMEMEFGGELTPQELNKLDKEYQNITGKYHNLAQKS
jgi:hypothetical protein